MAAIDLAPEQLTLVRELLLEHGVGPDHRPLVFGSRARGDARRYSDLDLTFAGEPLAPAVLRRLQAAFEESSLSIQVDAFNLADADPALRRQVLGSGVELELAVPR